MDIEPVEIAFSVGDILHDGFDTGSLLYSPLDSALDDLKFTFELDGADLVLVNGQPVNRDRYTLPLGDEVRITGGGRSPGQNEVQAALRALLDLSRWRCTRRPASASRGMPTGRA
jgi:hypothetical protein